MNAKKANRHLHPANHVSIPSPVPDMDAGLVTLQSHLVFPTVKLHDDVPRVEYALVALSVEDDLHGWTPDSYGVGRHLGPAGVRGELEGDGGPVAYGAGYAELAVDDYVLDVLLGDVDIGAEKDLAGVVRAREDEDTVPAGPARERGPVQTQRLRVFFAVQLSTV